MMPNKMTGEKAIGSTNKKQCSKEQLTVKEYKAMENSNFKEQLAEIDERIIKLKENADAGKALEELHEHPAFIKVILEGYFEKEVARLSGLMFNPTSLKRDQMENIMDKATAIRSFKQFFNTVLIDANMAPDQIAEEEAYRKELTAQHAELPEKE